MSPQSLLYTPVELLRDAPDHPQSASHGEGGRRRVAVAVIGCLLVGALAVIVASRPANPRCTTDLPHQPAQACSAAAA